MSRDSNPRLEMILQKLERVRPAGRGWVAKCPAHDDKSASLSLCVGRKNGSVLLNCFAGCHSSSILSAMNLRMEDLFENERVSDDMDQEQRAAIHEAMARAKWAAALEYIQEEALFLNLVAKVLAKGETLDRTSQGRLERSVGLLYDAHVHLTTGPNKRRMPIKHRPKVTGEKP